ncbi:hypothetical protein FRC12_019576 [Ceratobasidium sp. 428]|nr:hypothetical protein FRC12_019576 [Ceratobasidium sp. 428]
MSYPISHIFASDLKRANSTALSIYDAQPQPKPALITTQLLREQHFGDAEGQMWMSAGGRGGKFHNGESLDDVARRADRFFEEYLAPIIINARGRPPGETNVFVVSHSVTIAENLEALARRLDEGGYWFGVTENLAPPFVGGAFPALRMMIVAHNQHSHLKDATSKTYT